jgi:hypothetical protein
VYALRLSSAARFPSVLFRTALQGLSLTALYQASSSDPTRSNHERVPSTDRRQVSARTLQTRTGESKQLSPSRFLLRRPATRWTHAQPRAFAATVVAVTDPPVATGSLANRGALPKTTGRHHLPTRAPRPRSAFRAVVPSVASLSTPTAGTDGSRSGLLRFHRPTPGRWFLHR